VVGGDVSDAVFRFYSQALPRAGCGTTDGRRPAVPSLLQLREERVAIAGLTTKAPRRGVHRRKRERRPLPGMMLFQDGSKHAWLDLGPDLDLIVDDGRRDQRDHSIFLCEEEGTVRAFAGCRDDPRTRPVLVVLHRPGQPLLHDADGGREGRQDATDQVGRALKQLHIDHIPSYSPQARGRIERLWDTLQKRLPPC